MTYGWGLGIDNHELLKRLSMPFVMSKIFNKTVAEIKSEEPQSILGADIVELEDDMLTEPKRIFPAMNNTPKGTQQRKHSFYEACSLRKFGDLYYFVYSSHVNHELCYATSPYPDHGYTFRGVIISNGDIGMDGRCAKDRLNATGTNHGRIIQINGQYYIFYHRQTHNTEFSRQGCAEPITINEDGSIRQVEVTSCGLNGGPLKAQGKYSAAYCCNLTNGHMPHLSNFRKNPVVPNINHEDDTRFVKGMTDGTWMGFKYFNFTGETALKVTARGDGGSLSVMTQFDKPLAQIELNTSSKWIQSRPVHFMAEGKNPLYLVYHGKGKIDVAAIHFEE